MILLYHLSLCLWYDTLIDDIVCGLNILSPLLLCERIFTEKGGVGVGGERERERSENTLIRKATDIPQFTLFKLNWNCASLHFLSSTGTVQASI